MTTYAVKWREPDGRTYVGRLALGARTLNLVGRGRGAKAASVDRQISYSELRGLRVGHDAAERLDGRPALVVEGAEGHYLIADPGMGLPMVQEVADRLTALRSTATRTPPSSFR